MRLTSTESFENFMITFIIFIVLILAIAVIKDETFERYERNCNGKIVKAKYVPSGKHRIRKNVILENDETMPFSDWMKCDFVLKHNN